MKAEMERRLRAAMESAVAGEQPPRNLTSLVRRRHRRYLLRAGIAGAASVAAVAAGVPAGISLLGNGSGTGPAASSTGTIYAAFDKEGLPLSFSTVPINAATNKPGKPIPFDGELTVTPNGKTLYITPGGETIPVSTATNKPGKPIHVPGHLTIDPNGKTGYLDGPIGGTITPLNLATNKPGKPFGVCSIIGDIAFTPDGKTAYVTCPGAQQSAVIPVNTATNKPGKLIRLNSDLRSIVITSDGKTVYVGGNKGVIPISTTTNTPGRPIGMPFGDTSLLAISPDGKTLWVGGIGLVISISTATNRFTRAIPIGAGVPAESMVFTPDGKTAYVANAEGPTGRVVPINTVADKAGRPIIVGLGAVIAITPDGRTVYAVVRNKVVPISTATNKPGKPIRTPYGDAQGIVIGP